MKGGAGHHHHTGGRSNDGPLSSRNYKTHHNKGNPNKHGKYDDNIQTHMFMDMSLAKYDNESKTTHDVFQIPPKEEKSFFGKIGFKRKRNSYMGSEQSLESEVFNVHEEYLYRQWSQQQQNRQENIYETTHKPIYRSNIPKYRSDRPPDRYSPTYNNHNNDNNYNNDRYNRYPNEVFDEYRSDSPRQSKARKQIQGVKDHFFIPVGDGERFLPFNNTVSFYIYTGCSEKNDSSFKFLKRGSLRTTQF